MLEISQTLKGTCRRAAAPSRFCSRNSRAQCYVQPSHFGRHTRVTRCGRRHQLGLLPLRCTSWASRWFRVTSRAGHMVEINSLSSCIMFVCLFLRLCGRNLIIRVFPDVDMAERYPRLYRYFSQRGLLVICVGKRLEDAFPHHRFGCLWVSWIVHP